MSKWLSLLLAVTAVSSQAAEFKDYIDPVFKIYPKAQPGSDSIKVQKMRVIVLSDMAINRQTHGEWGYSALVDGVDAEGKPFSILFDTGAETGTVWYNVQKLGDPNDPKQNLVNKLCSTNVVILSHNHQDHTAGLLTLRRECMAKGYSRALQTAYLGGPEALWPRQDRSGGKNPDGTYPEDNYLIYPRGPGPADDPKLGSIEKQYRDLGGSFVMAETPRQIFPGVWTSGKVHRVTKEKMYWQFAEDGPMIGADGSEYHDAIPEDHGLVINTDTGLVALTGCGHAGVINVIRHAREWVVAGNRPVVAVVGGIHLFPANEIDMKIVKEGFLAAGVRYLLGSHCTGFESVVWLREQVAMKPKDAVMGAIGTLIRTAPGGMEIAWLKGPMVNRHPSLVK